jgi:hypothetical protein
MWKVTDRTMRLVVDARGDEPVERIALLVHHAERAVGRAGDLARFRDHAPEYYFEVQLRHHGAAHLEQPTQQSRVSEAR